MIEWIGMKKADSGKLFEFLKGYIGLVAITTAQKVICIRQLFYRQKLGEPLDTPRVMFPNIVRADADKGIPQCIKFLFNYGFYKFGLEITLIGIVALVGTRLDIYSVIYSIWLFFLFSMNRKSVSRIWPVFRIFVVVLVLIQYAIVVGLPTWLCIGKNS